VLRRDGEGTKKRSRSSGRGARMEQTVGGLRLVLWSTRWRLAKACIFPSVSLALSFSLLSSLPLSDSSLILIGFCTSFPSFTSSYTSTSGSFERKPWGLDLHSFTLKPIHSLTIVTIFARTRDKKTFILSLHNLTRDAKTKTCFFKPNN
jgi:hypothetical protein